MAQCSVVQCLITLQQASCSFMLFIKLLYRFTQLTVANKVLSGMLMFCDIYCHVNFIFSLHNQKELISSYQLLSVQFFPYIIESNVYGHISSYLSRSYYVII